MLLLISQIPNDMSDTACGVIEITSFSRFSLPHSCNTLEEFRICY